MGRVKLFVLRLDVVNGIGRVPIIVIRSKLAFGEKVFNSVVIFGKNFESVFAVPRLRVPARICFYRKLYFEDSFLAVNNGVVVTAVAVEKNVT